MKSGNKLEKYEPYIAAAIALLFIISGIIAGIFLDTPSETTGLVIIDLTSTCKEEWLCTEWQECKDNFQQRDCLDFHTCGTTEFKPVEIRDCKAETSALTGLAVFETNGESDILKGAIYLISFLSLLIIAAYVVSFYLREKAMRVSWLTLAYWLAMIGLPLSIYYAVARQHHIVGAYILLAVSIIALVVLVVVKPWAPPSIPEIRNINELLNRNTFETNDHIRRLKKAREEREKTFPKFMENILRRRRKREMDLKGINEKEISRINRKISSLARSPKTRKSIEAVAESIREREARFQNLNRKLAKWADKRRSQRQELFGKERRDTEEPKNA